MANRFVERLANGPVIVADGGMGVLVSSAAPRLRVPEEANLRAPETVVKLHAGFIAAGADLIETNTFGANRRKLAAHYLEDDLHAINSTAVKLARDAREMAGRDVFIAGSIGPLGELEAVSDEERTKIFAEQAEILEGRGVDLFSVETFFDLAELESAIAAVRSVSSLPILAMLTFDEQAETLAGVTARDAVTRLEELGVAAVGANHGAGIQAALRALNAMSGNGLPLAAMPNIGLASMAGNRIVYPHATPDYFAEFAAHARSLGARVIGGCCGTTPTEIAAIAEAVAEERAPTAPLVFAEHEVVVRLAEEKEETELARMFREGEFVVSVQIDPPLGGSYDGMLDVARTLKAVGQRPPRRHQRQRDRPGGGERADAVDRDRALDRARDDSASDDPRRDDHGPRVAAPRRARVRDPQRALGDRRSRRRSATTRARAACTRSTRSGSRT